MESREGVPSLFCPLLSCRPRSVAFGEGGTTPKVAFRRLAPTHGLATPRTIRGRGLLLFPRLDAFGHETLAKATGFFEGFALRFDLPLQHFQGASDDDEHRVGHHHGIVGIEPAGVFLALFQRMFRRLVNYIVRERRRIERDGVDGFRFRSMDRPRELVPVEDQDLVVAAQFASSPCLWRSRNAPNPR